MRWGLPALLALSMSIACAGEPKQEDKDKSGPPPAVKLDERGFTALGTVRFHPEKKIVEADGWFNMQRGFIEYLACAPDVKSHETLVALDCNPADLHTALLLAGFKPSDDPSAGGGVAAVGGDRVMILVRWEEKLDATAAPANGAAPQPRLREERAEDLLINGFTEEPMERCGFAFNGSRFIDVDVRDVPPQLREFAKPAKRDETAQPPGGADPAAEMISIFAALFTGELVTVGHRRDAILNNPLELLWDDGQYDGNYYAYMDRIPPVDPEDPPKVTMIFRRPVAGEVDETLRRMQAPAPAGEAGKGKDAGQDTQKEKETDRACGPGGKEVIRILAFMVVGCVTLSVLAEDPGKPAGGAAGAPKAAAKPTLATKKSVSDAIARGTAWLTQHPIEGGGWGTAVPDKGMIADVGVTAMVVHALAISPGALREDNAVVASAVKYLLSNQQPDGSIYSQGLANYKTSVTVSALAALDANRPEKRYTEVIEKARAMISGLQNTEESGTTEEAGDRRPMFGGIGYSHDDRRPDLSNTQFAIEALHAAGLSEDSDVYKRAIVFLERCQNRKASNDMIDGKKQSSSDDGGFIYAPGDSKAGAKEDPGGARSFSSYGSMTYAGLKSYIYAGLERDDPRVAAAWGWIQKNYTVMENPGMAQPEDPKRGWMGLYYYYVMMARTLDLLGVKEVETPDGVKHDWARELAGRVVELQDKDGFWRNPVDRWWEGSDALCTAYAVQVLSICLPHVKE